MAHWKLKAWRASQPGHHRGLAAARRPETAWVRRSSGGPAVASHAPLLRAPAALCGYRARFLVNPTHSRIEVDYAKLPDQIWTTSRTIQPQAKERTVSHSYSLQIFRHHGTWARRSLVEGYNDNYCAIDRTWRADRDDSAFVVGDILPCVSAGTRYNSNLCF